MNSRPISYHRLIVASLVLYPVIAAGQQFQGPISGFVFDGASGSLRPIAGIAGAAYLGDPILADLTFASVAPNGKHGIAIKDGQAWYLSELSPVALLPIPGAIEYPEKIVWSRDSSTAVLYSPSTGKLQSIGLLGVASPVIDLAPLGSVTTLTVDRTGEHIAAGIEGDSAGIYLIGPDSPPALVAGDTGKNSALAFSINGDRLYAADRDARRILEIQNGAVSGVFLDENDTPADPVALAASADNKFLYIASGEKSAIQVYEISPRQAVAEIQLDFAPCCLEPLSNPSVFRLNIPGAHTPLLVFDTRAGASVFFVPVPAVGGTER